MLLDNLHSLTNPVFATFTTPSIYSEVTLVSLLTQFEYFFSLSTSTTLSLSPTVSFTTKVVASISFLIVIRGGVPRYRYDFLTKLGWVKFLTFVVTIFVVTLLMSLLL